MQNIKQHPLETISWFQCFNPYVGWKHVQSDNFQSVCLCVKQIYHIRISHRSIGKQRALKMHNHRQCFHWSPAEQQWETLHTGFEKFIVLRPKTLIQSKNQSMRFEILKCSGIKTEEKIKRFFDVFEYRATGTSPWRTNSISSERTSLFLFCFWFLWLCQKYHFIIIRHS